MLTKTLSVSALLLLGACIPAYHDPCKPPPRPVIDCLPENIQPGYDCDCEVAAAGGDGPSLTIPGGPTDPGDDDDGPGDDDDGPGDDDDGPGDGDDGCRGCGGSDDGNGDGSDDGSSDDNGGDSDDHGPGKPKDDHGPGKPKDDHGPGKPKDDHGHGNDPGKIDPSNPGKGPKNR